MAAVATREVAAGDIKATVVAGGIKATVVAAVIRR